MSDYITPDARRQIAAAWFEGYSAGNLDGYFGTHDERDKSPYADLDPYGSDLPVCGVGGPREATSDCVASSGHLRDHIDDTGGTWPAAESPRFTTT